MSSKIIISDHRLRTSGEENLLLQENVEKHGNTLLSINSTMSSKVQPKHNSFTSVATEQVPVRLTPAWEENNLPNDELNFKTLSMDDAVLENNPPKDRWNIVYLILVLHGIGILMPWNMFINAKSYFVDYKLGNVYLANKSDYASIFMVYLTISSQLPNLLFNWLNIFCPIGGKLTTRIVWSILTEVVCFVFTVSLVMIDTSEKPELFFWSTIGIIVLLNMANGVYNNSVFGMAAKLPTKFIGAVILGTNLSGTFTSITSILSISIAPDARTAAIYYFTTALFVLLACFDTYFALPLNRFYKYHELIYQREIENQESKQNGENDKIPYWNIFKQAFPQLFNVFFIFFVTLSIFPVVHSDIKQSNINFFIHSKYYVSVLCFLTFNLSALIGTYLSTLCTWPKPKFLFVPVILRVVLVPLFLICNYHPIGHTRLMPVIIQNDYIFWILGIILGLSSGYFSSVAMMYTPRCVEPRYSSIAGMFGAAFLLTGICCGILFGMLMPLIVNCISW
ncbi:Equilibrative nucleoside transporter,Major facilitator superfamily domain [Cinara cedri]|uniref:Equilibrative nucleoside transporter,Major facilitator superfamily domain n=1 Tax=Cinara cedri TaxID=506608 RepID=A0A5E4MFM4_9HEMI|nr:Equilibrative nucleoside transporter,Major facilitator superfamily domain [Cinara cedri]